MGSLILCHKKKAKHPYEISRIHTRISTLEELCYYLCNNLYLIDYTIMNEQLCRWIADELEMQDLAVKLVELIRNHGSVEKFVVLVLHESRIYTPGEMAHIQNVLEKLKNQKEVERQKYKADKLMESGELESAILVYMSIVNGEKDDSVDKRFYGRVSLRFLPEHMGEHFCMKSRRECMRRRIRSVKIIKCSKVTCMQVPDTCRRMNIRRWSWAMKSFWKLTTNLQKR